MGLPSFLQRLGRRPVDADAARSDGDAVGAARARARRRLIGAVVLLLIGVIGFPLLFETQPRPVAVDVPIVIPARDGSGAPVLSTAPAARTGVGSVADPDSQGPREVIEPSRAAAQPSSSGGAVANPGADGGADAGGEAAARVSAERRAAEAPSDQQPATDEAARAAKAAADKAAADKLAAQKAAADQAASTKAAADKLAAEKAAAAKVAADKAASEKAATEKAAAAAKDRAADASEAARARALLEGRAVPASAPPAVAAATTPATGRSVVQVGAYADERQMQKVRQRLEQMGYKTYTQVVTVRGQRTTRVRVGPFDDRAKAEEVAERVKAAGLPAAVLAL